MRSLLLLLPLLVMTACQQMPEPEFKWAKFSVTSFGEYQPLSETRPQLGKLLRPLDRASFREITIAQGGADGDLDSVRIFSDGTGYAVATDSNGNRAYRVEIRLSDDELSQLIEAAQKDRIHSIPAMLASNIRDGSVGFVQLVTAAGSVACWLSNYFERVANLYEFCNRAIWPKIIKNDRLIVPSTKTDGKIEYRRIFKSQ